jgi:dolichol-phosphate mannosyltransferase
MSDFTHTSYQTKNTLEQSTVPVGHVPVRRLDIRQAVLSAPVRERAERNDVMPLLSQLSPVNSKPVLGNEAPPVPSSPVVMEAAVVVPTLNERDNITALLDGILRADARLHVIVVDDGSCDGTAQAVCDVAQARASRGNASRGNSRVHLISRGRKLGYASAVQDGMRFGLQHGAQLILLMDADFSHDPRYLSALLEKSKDCNLVIGSRYVRGGGTRNWGLDRKILSGSANALARRLLHLPARDCTGGFRCWHRDLILESGVLDVEVQGYAFLFVTLDRCRRVGARIGEVPIIFVDRQYGQSKMSRRIIVEAVRVLFSLWFRRVMRRD